MKTFRYRVGGRKSDNHRAISIAGRIDMKWVLKKRSKKLMEKIKQRTDTKNEAKKI